MRRQNTRFRTGAPGAAILLTAGAVLAGCGAGAPPDPAPDREADALPAARDLLAAGAVLEVPSFSLLDQGGEPFGTAQLEGRVWIAHLTSTRCTDVCPEVTAGLRGLQDELAGAPGWDDVRIVSFSVDPETDTPAVLADHAREVGADGDLWRFLTGRPNQIRQLSRHGLRLPLEAGPDGEPTFPAGDVLLVDRLQRVRGVFDGASTDGRAALARDLRELAGAPPLRAVAHPEEVLDPPWLDGRRGGPARHRRRPRRGPRLSLHRPPARERHHVPQPRDGRFRQGLQAGPLRPRERHRGGRRRRRRTARHLLHQPGGRQRAVAQPRRRRVRQRHARGGRRPAGRHQRHRLVRRHGQRRRRRPLRDDGPRRQPPVRQRRDGTLHGRHGGGGARTRRALVGGRLLRLQPGRPAGSVPLQRRRVLVGRPGPRRLLHRLRGRLRGTPAARAAQRAEHPLREPGATTASWTSPRSGGCPTRAGPATPARSTPTATAGPTSTCSTCRATISTSRTSAASASSGAAASSSRARPGDR